MKKLVVVVATVILVAGMVGCAPVQYSLTVSSTEGGRVTGPGEGTFDYGEGEVVNLVAEAEEGYRFENWTGDVGTIDDVNAASTTITMNDNYSIAANFIAQYVLTIDSTDGGEVTIPGEGSFNYDEGTIVILEASPDTGYRFVSWTGDVSTIAGVEDVTTTITMNGDYTITANFVQGQLIQNWYDLHAIRNNLGGIYLLMNDLDSTTAGYTELASPNANGGAGWEPIGRGTRTLPFTGSFNGQGHEIRDLFIGRSGEDGVGLFGDVDEIGIVENLGVMNAEVTGEQWVGGLVGYNRGTVSNSYSTGNVTGDDDVGGLVGMNDLGSISNSFSSAKLSGNESVGGLVGYNHKHGTASDSYSTGNVIGNKAVGGLMGTHQGTVSNSYATSSVTGDWLVGGLVGDNDGTVTDSYSTGNVTGDDDVGGLVGMNDLGTISNSFSTGIVSGESYVGGLVGRNTYGTSSNSFWDIQTSGQSTSAGGTGETTVAMKNIATFSGAGWYIIAVALGEKNPTYTWNIVDGETYPFLHWQSAL
ncbi:MAG: GLUG motif-containing protein [Dehalococcoidia bacterium]